MKIGTDFMREAYREFFREVAQPQGPEGDCSREFTGWLRNKYPELDPPASAGDSSEEGARGE